MYVSKLIINLDQQQVLNYTIKVAEHLIKTAKTRKISVKLSRICLYSLHVWHFGI
ncbi:MAG: hypothetical protein ACTSV7_11760 [Candidatus Baldrarchaeia archaeon]